jgi:UDPglucose 6-dehydrogenase
MKIKNICCIGAGYVGGPTMAVIALKCPHINVTVVDANLEKIIAWNGPLDKLPVYEPGLAEVVEKVRNKNLYFSENIKSSIDNAEMIFMAVNTPTKTDGEGAGMASDLSYIKSCAEDIAKYSKSNKIVIEKSTLPVRTAEKIKEILKSKNKEIDFEILSNPEFLAEGTAINDLFKSDRVLIGGDQTPTGKKAIQELVNIYTNWIPRDKIYTTNVWSSELSKLVSNAMLAQRISSINSMSALCEKTGANIKEISKAAGMDHRIGPHFLKASVGFGGSCFQKDVLNLVYLCRHYGLNEVAEFWHQVVKINNYQKERFSQKIIDTFNGNLKNKRVALLGWSFKPNTTDSRETPAVYVAGKLLEQGAIIEVNDPMIKFEQIKNDLRSYYHSRSIPAGKIGLLLKNITYLSFEKITSSEFSSIAIITAWPDYASLDWESLIPKTKIFDGCHVTNKNKNIYSIGE